jgi:hypothetical protein
MKQSSMGYALDVLRKHRTVLEMNLKYTPGIIVNVDMLPVYKKQLREVMRAIERLEMIEVQKHN